MKYSTYILILLLLIYECKIILLTFFIYVFYVLLPSCYSKDKRISYFLTPILFLLPFIALYGLKDGLYGIESKLFGIILIVFIFYILFKGIWSAVTFKEQIDISIKALPFYGLNNIISCPWKRIFIFSQFIILAIVVSLIIGWSLSDLYALIATPILSVICFICYS